MSVRKFFLYLCVLGLSTSVWANEFLGVPVPARSVHSFQVQQKQWHKDLGTEKSVRDQQWFGDAPYGGGEFVFKTNFKATQHILTSETKRVLQETHAAFDDSGRRFTVGNNSKNKSAFVLIGDSYVMGDFANDDQTIPSFAKRQLPNANVYNLGFPGNDPGNFLSHLSDSWPALANINETQKTYVYFYTYDYLRRLVGTADWLNSCDCHWKRARYKVVNDELVYQGTHADRRGFLAPLDRWATAKLGNRTSLTNPTIDGSTFVLQAKIFQALAKSLAPENSKSKFLVYLPPGALHASEMVSQLRKLHVPFIDQSDLDRESLMGADSNDAIVQPTTLENEFVGLNLATALLKSE